MSNLIGGRPWILGAPNELMGKFSAALMEFETEKRLRGIFTLNCHDNDRDNMFLTITHNPNEQKIDMVKNFAMGYFAGMKEQHPWSVSQVIWNTEIF